MSFIHADVNNYDQLSKAFQGTNFDYIFHYAALVGVQRTLSNPMIVLDDIQGFKNILELAKDANPNRIFFASSSEVYGEPVHIPQNEDFTPLNSRLPYAIVKNVGEAFFKTYGSQHNLNYTIFRFFNTYGINQSEDFVMSKFINAALENEDITIYGEGQQSRTFCHINDNIDACIAAMQSDNAVNEIFNIGNDKIMSILELAEMIIRITNSKSQIKFLPPLKEGDMSRRQPDISKMKSFLERELIPIEKGIYEIIEHKRMMNTVVS
jgi:UDP-glucose 4-epimerase